MGGRWGCPRTVELSFLYSYSSSTAQKCHHAHPPRGTSASNQRFESWSIAVAGGFSVSVCVPCPFRPPQPARRTVASLSHLDHLGHRHRRRVGRRPTRRPRASTTAVHRRPPRVVSPRAVAPLAPLPGHHRLASALPQRASEMARPFPASLALLGADPALAARPECIASIRQHYACRAQQLSKHCRLERLGPLASAAAQTRFGSAAASRPAARGRRDALAAIQIR